MADRIAPVCLALLVYAGQVKANPALAWLPVDLTVLMAVGVIIGMIAARVHYGPASPRVTIPLAVWVLFMPAVALSQLGPKTTTLFTFTLLLAVAPFYLLRSRTQRLAFLVALTIVALLVTVSATIIAPTTAADYSDRLLLEGSDTIGTARVAMSGAIIVAVSALFPGTPVRLRLLLLAVALGTGTLGIATGSRGPVLAAAVALLLVVILTPAFRKSRGRALIGLGVVGVVAVWVSAQSNSNDGMARIVAVITGESDSSSATRVGLWSHATDLMERNPFGLGWGGFDYGPHSYPHNLVLEVGVEAGWIVLGAVVILLIWAMIRGARVSTDLTMTAMYGLFIFGLLNAMVSSDINGSRLMWVALFALLVAPIEARRDRMSPQRTGRTQRSQVSSQPLR